MPTIVVRSITNISSGHIDSNGNVTPSRIQSVINTFMRNGAENYIESAYHSARHLYHVNFIYRNAGNTAVVSQRHMVYNLDTDTWTEYVYRDSSGTRVYETNFALAHDSLGNEVLLIPYLSSTTGVLSYVYQSEYEGTTASGNADEILDSAGADGTALDKPMYSFCDSSDNVYVISYNCDMFKVTSAGVKSCLTTQADVLVAIGLTSPVSPRFRWGVPDVTNSCVYVSYSYVSVTQSYFGIVRIALDGTVALVKTGHVACGAGAGYGYPFALSSDGATLYTFKHDDAGKYLVAIAGPGTTNTETTYYNFTTNGYTGTKWYLQRTGNDLFFLYENYSVSLPNWQLAKFDDITGAASLSFIDTGLSSSASAWGAAGCYPVSDTEIYCLFNDGQVDIYKVSYSGGTWSSVAVVEDTATLASVAATSRIFQNTAGDFTLYCMADTFNIYGSTFGFKQTITISGLDDAVGVSHLLGDEAAENVLIVCGYTSDNVYKYYPGSWVLGDTEPELEGTIIDIVSHHYDLGIPNDKRVCRAYLPMESKYATWGAMTLEAGYEINNTIHEDGESSEPSGATSLRPFAHGGVRTWNYTNDQFDSTTEQWLQYRLDVGCRGKEFRYSIRAGDVSSSNTGRYRLRVPRLDVQILSKQ